MPPSAPPAHEALRTADPFVHREGTRIVAALAALLAAALLATGGLLWHEHARARQRPPAPTSTLR